jgi:hypothetical protein
VSKGAAPRYRPAEETLHAWQLFGSRKQSFCLLRTAVCSGYCQRYIGYGSIMEAGFFCVTPTARESSARKPPCPQVNSGTILLEGAPPAQIRQRQKDDRLIH